MTYHTRKDLPYQYALADAFTVCDNYHCSLLGPTDPNRYHMWTGWVGNDGSGGGPVINNAEAGYDWSTYPERLERAGVSWKVYQDIGTGLNAAGSWGWTTSGPRTWCGTPTPGRSHRTISDFPARSEGYARQRPAVRSACRRQSRRPDADSHLPQHRPGGGGLPGGCSSPSTTNTPDGTPRRRCAVGRQRPDPSASRERTAGTTSP
jgi:hypothetical protein